MKKFKKVTDAGYNFFSALFIPLVYIAIIFFMDDQKGKDFIFSEVGSLTIVLMIVIGYLSRELDDIKRFLQKRYEREQLEKDSFEEDEEQ